MNQQNSDIVIKYQEKEIDRLKNALTRINNSIVKDGNTITMSMSIFELKGIVETALGEPSRNDVSANFSKENE